MKKIRLFLVCTALCLSFSACSHADFKDSDGESLQNEVSLEHQENPEITDQVSDSQKNAASVPQPLKLSVDVKSGKNESSDPTSGYGYIVDTDGNVIEYVPAVDISEVSSEAAPDVDLDETDFILDNLATAASMCLDQSEYGTYRILDSGFEALIGGNYVNIFVEAEIGTDIQALESGTVTETGYSAGLGYYVCVESGDGRFIKYAHLSEIKSEEGNAVEKGQVIGCAGITGAASKSGTSYILIES